MNLKNIEVQLACQCAPVITGLKASNLLITDTKNIRVLHRILSSSDISYFILFSDKEKTVLFLFHKYRLESFLKQENIRRLLMCFGYEDSGTERQLCLLRKRYTVCRLGDGEFPHEIGLFLEYPIEDVIGFIENDGENCKCSGYWKVYENKEGKIQIFREFDKAKETLIKLIAGGVSILNIIDYCKQNHTCMK